MVGGVSRERETRGGCHGREACLTIWFLLLQIQKAHFCLLCCCLTRERVHSSQKSEALKHTMEKGGLLNLTPKKSVSTSDDFTRNATRAVAIETVLVMVYRV